MEVSMQQHLLQTPLPFLERLGSYLAELLKVEVTELFKEQVQACSLAADCILEQLGY